MGSIEHLYRPFVLRRSLGGGPIEHLYRPCVLKKRLVGSSRTPVTAMCTEEEVGGVQSNTCNGHVY